MYAVTSTPVVRRTRATLRSAELGFFGVCVKTRVQTPRRWGEPFSAGVLVFSDLVSRPLRTSWAIVGTRDPSRDFGRASKKNWGRGAQRRPLPKPTKQGISGTRAPPTR